MTFFPRFSLCASAFTARAKAAYADALVLAVCALGVAASTLALTVGPPLRAFLFGAALLPKVISRSYVIPYAELAVLRAVAVVAVVTEQHQMLLPRLLTHYTILGLE